MKTFKNLQAFKKRIQNGTDWDDYFKLGGKMWNIYEYGGGSMFHMDYDYVYFLNKRSGDMIYVKYDCPSVQYIDNKKVEVRKYKFISLELQAGNSLWR